MNNITSLLSQAQTELLEKIRERGQVNHRKLSIAELIDAIELNELGLIKFRKTRRGNNSSFLVINEGGEG